MHCLEIECVGHVKFAGPILFVCICDVDNNILTNHTLRSLVLLYDTSLHTDPPWSCWRVCMLPPTDVHVMPHLWYCASSNYRGIIIAIRLASCALVYHLCCNISKMIRPTDPIDIARK